MSLANVISYESNSYNNQNTSKEKYKKKKHTEYE